MRCEVILAIHAMKSKFITDTLNRGFQQTQRTSPNKTPAEVGYKWARKE